MKKIGIMGGTFDPIHYGHLVTAEAAREKFHLDEVVFVPSGIPPHKKKRLISDPHHRCFMVELAIASNPNFTISETEIKREGYSFAADTVDTFVEIYGKNAEIYFITGGDAIKEILSWHKIDDLIKKCSFIAATRPGYDFSNGFHLPSPYQEKVFPLKVTALAISSSQIRSMTAIGESIKYLVPEDVEKYIHVHGLYRQVNEE
ncbi:MAG: nicotinate-nucleotide adenylyltransferase [Clostridiales bacterium]